MIIKHPYQYVRGERYTIPAFDRILTPRFTGRPYRKHDQARKNADRPDLKPRRRKYWDRIARAAVPFYYTHTGIGVGNPQAVARVTLEE